MVAMSSRSGEAPDLSPGSNRPRTSERGRHRHPMTDRPNKKLKTAEAGAEAKPVRRRVYINQRIPRLREEVKALKKEADDLRQGSDGGAPKDAKANRNRIY